MKVINLLVLVILVLAGCMHEKNAETASEQLGLADNPTDNANDPAGSPKLVKVASIRFQVADASEALKNIERIVARYPAYIADSRMSVTGVRIEKGLTVKIPPEYFDRFLTDIDSQSIFTEFRNITATDVTKEFVDLEARLKTKREVHERLKEILRTKTGTIDEVLSAERQLGEVQEELEAATGKLNLLKDRIAYSRIEIAMYQVLRQEATFAPGVGTRLRNAFASGFEGTVDVMIGLVHLWPLLLILSVGAMIYRKRNGGKGRN
jgi:hypothetical protein